ncbi:MULTISPECIES: metal ABC transporter solute-binding protein, Zn/Mn family [unclassified Paenibacillus]|uniref:metal ABC transporter solute-binding protein, Zn/Mn family n=1 Tax=unclassified Paenibacillus TaxID=185978 RepID=UPI0009A64876|nr:MULTISPECIES: zinc ABC transporter substrate-binding protein [unclassified Paenibacillus]SLK20982.1 zinc transport system substrate-binding protein/iron/zinc/copper transport system substrate-binding protein [Paenibacillus sp. RU5A]SOC76411.1 zinc transport system substrate-binding protein/iron/zinc/copper transport system substrate-binding protein [Paenibacillus sp. RU26A]SOC77913.1 zinc transport system substrate-binding protein/iron/zinc/copper transport system substrate-binding protein [P
MKNNKTILKKFSPLLVLVMGTILFTGCTGNASSTVTENAQDTEPKQAETVTPKIVASTSWTALLAKTAGADSISTLAPVDMKHPNEYDFKPTDIEKVNDASTVIYSEYEPFMKQILEAADVPEEARLIVMTENTPDMLREQITTIAESLGTTDTAQQALKEIDSTFEAVNAETSKLDTESKRVVAQAYMVPVAKALGYEVVGEFGPTEVTPTQAAELAAMKPALIIDNLHFPQGAEIANIADRPIVELRNYPETAEQTLVQLIQDNAKKLGLTLAD